MPSHRRRLCALIALLAVAVSLGGCGGDDVRDEVQAARDRVQQRVAEVKERFEERRERYGRRIREVFGDLERVFPRADDTSPTVRSQGDNEPETIDAFMTRVLTNVDRYWTRTFAAADLPEPQVAFVPVPPRNPLPTACGSLADDAAAFYCPGDDTIYVAQVFAADLYRGVLRGLPGESAGYGRAAGDFAVAYVLAHEYAHNLQQELGIFDNAIGALGEALRAAGRLHGGHVGALGLRTGAARSPATSRRRRAPRSPSATSTSATSNITARPRNAAPRC